MLDELKTDSKVVGIKQLRKALIAGKAKRVFIALDADPALTEPLVEQCKLSQIEVITVPTMKQLGDACESTVAAAAAAIIYTNHKI